MGGWRPGWPVGRGWTGQSVDAGALGAGTRDLEEAGLLRDHLDRVPQADRVLTGRSRRHHRTLETVSRQFSRLKSKRVIALPSSRDIIIPDVEILAAIAQIESCSGAFDERQSLAIA